MAKFYVKLGQMLHDFIAEQHMFFVASAPTAGGHVNLYPQKDWTPFGF